MKRLVHIQSYPEGPRVWLCGQRVHHCASGLVLCALSLACSRRRCAAALAAWALTDWHDARVWFARECLPADCLA